jgi:hypothetical protein
MYTSTFDESKVTGEQREIAERIEKELLQDTESKMAQALEGDGDHSNDELKYSSVVRDHQQ